MIEGGEELTPLRLLPQWGVPFRSPTMLETVFSPSHQYHDRIFYDVKEGSYYDKYSDIYLTLEQVRAFGLPA